MTRMLALIGAVALVAGCRTPESNPFAAFGSATIPPPTIEMPSGGSYYTTPPASVPGATTVPPTNALPSISVPSGGAIAPQPSIPRAPYSFGGLAPRSSSPSFTTDPTDREPIRVVEAAPGEARVATAPSSRTATPSVVEAAPAEREPIRAFNTNPPKTAIPPYVPSFGLPPAGGFKSSGSFRTGGNILPAEYHQAVPAYFEQPGASAGQWRSR